MASVASHVRVRLFFVCISTWRFGKFIGGCQTNSSWSGRRDAAKFDVSFCLHNRRRSDNATRPKSANRRKECGADLRRPWPRAKIATFNWPRRVTARRALDGCLQPTVASSARPPADLPMLEQCESLGVW